MRRALALSLLSGCIFLASCAEVAIFTAGAVVGGVVGYYAGKEGYKIKVEKERRR